MNESMSSQPSRSGRWPAGIFVCFFSVCGAFSAAADEPRDALVTSDDRLALIGGTLIESLQFDGSFEAALVLSRPDLRLPVRNLGWSGDDARGTARRVFGNVEDGYERLLSDLEKAAPSVALIGYGWAEASSEAMATEAFAGALERLCGDLQTRQVRLILLQPFALPGIKVAGYEERIAECRATIERLAGSLDAAVIDPGRNLDRSDFDAAGLRLSAAGHRRFGEYLAAELLGLTAAEVARRCEIAEFPKLATAVTRKDAWFFHRHRPMNETYLFLFRKHEQGNNAPEVAQFEPLVREAEQQIWSTAAGLR
jgi:hypothetical protein